MIIRCQHCNTAYNIPEAKIVSGQTKVRCQKCQTVFTIGQAVVEEPEYEIVETPDQMDSDLADKPNMFQSSTSQEDELDAFLAAESVGQETEQQATNAKDSEDDEDNLKVDDWLDKFDNTGFSLLDEDGGGKQAAAALSAQVPQAQVQTQAPSAPVVQNADDLDDSAFKDLFEGDFGLDQDETEAGPAVQLKADATTQTDLGMMFEDFDAIDSESLPELEGQVFETEESVPASSIDSALDSPAENELIERRLQGNDLSMEELFEDDLPADVEIKKGLGEQFQEWAQNEALEEVASESREESTLEPVHAEAEIRSVDKPDAMTWESALMDELEISEDEIAELSQLTGTTDGRIHEVEVQTSEASDDDFFTPSPQAPTVVNQERPEPRREPIQKPSAVPKPFREDEDTIVIDQSDTDDETILVDGEAHKTEIGSSNLSRSQGPPGRRDGFTEKDGKKAAKDRKAKGKGTVKKARLMPMFLVVLFILVLGAAGYYFYPKWFGLSQEVASTPTPPKPAQPVEQPSEPLDLAINLKDVQQYVVKHQALGVILVIEGLAVNDSKKTKESIKVEISLLDGQSAVVLAKSVYSGPTLTQDQMQAMEKSELEAFFAQDSSGSYKVVPGDSLRFMVAFIAPPRTVEDFQVKVVGAQNAL